MLGQVTSTSPGGFSAAVRGINSGTGGLGIGVYGSQNGSGWGVYGTSPSGVGVYGQSSSGLAGFFSGNVRPPLNGNLTATGTKNFQIDDPLDPAHRYLLHAAIESNQVLNVYSGNVTTDEPATATVRASRLLRPDQHRPPLPADGDRPVRPGDRRAEGIANNRFAIRTSKPNVEVSWQVTARRNDPYMRAHPFRAVQAKTAADGRAQLPPR